MEPIRSSMMRHLRWLTAIGIIALAATTTDGRTRPPTPTSGSVPPATPIAEPHESGMCYESSDCFPCDDYPCRPFAASRAYCCQVIGHLTATWCPSGAFNPADNSCTQCEGACVVPTPMPTVCPQPTPEYLTVDPVVSPTDELTQTVVVRMGNGDRVDVSSEAGTFSFEGAFSRQDPARVTVTLLPNTANHLRVYAHVRPTTLHGCPFGNYWRQTTVDEHGAPLTIVQGTERSPTVTVPPPSPTPPPTDAPDPSCPAHVSLSPPAGPPGTIVDLQGLCYQIHSGARAQLYLDDEPLLMLGGSTRGEYRALFVVPSAAAAGFHRVRIVTYHEIGSGLFEVTQNEGPCFGDCNADERVAINELVIGVRILLGDEELDSCTAFDSSNDGFITIDELVLAVNRILGGCRVPPTVASLSGSYTFAHTESDDGYPGSVQVELEPGTVETAGERVMIEFPYFGGTVRVGGTPELDGSLGLIGELLRHDVPPVPLIGYAITLKSTAGQWISGELSADTAETSWPALIRFSLSRM